MAGRRLFFDLLETRFWLEARERGASEAGNFGSMDPDLSAEKNYQTRLHSTVRVPCGDIRVDKPKARPGWRSKATVGGGAGENSPPFKCGAK